ncbi:hypothetical protein EMCRGX_G024783 [Ephydatia muelleri]
MVRAVIPEAGFCVKTVTDKGEKVFVNICQSEQLPTPKDITDEQLLALLESGDPSQYRISLSLGEPHREKDNAGQECTAYDVIISGKFFETIQKRPVMKDFLLTVVLEGLEEKYGVVLSRDCKVLKNRKFLGPLPEQVVRQKPKPYIVEMGSMESLNQPQGAGGASGKKASKTLQEELNDNEESTTPQPQYTLMREPVDGNLPDFMVMEIQLPGIGTSKNLCLEVGEDRLVLKTRPKLFHLDVDLPYLVHNQETGAQFNGQSKVLTITLPVAGHALC